MCENIISLRVRNAKLELRLASKPAQRAIRRIRTELARRGLTAAQREGILHDNLLMLMEAEAAGGDPVEVLLGTTDVSSFDAAIDAFCDNVASECPHLPTALVVVRFCALLLVALAVVLAAHLAYRVGSRTPGGWLPWYLVNLRYVDSLMLKFEFTVVPLVFLVVQIAASLVRRNPWPHALPAVATPALFGLAVGTLSVAGPIELPGGFVIYNPLAPDSLLPLMRKWLDEGLPCMSVFTSPVGTIDYPWVSINIFLGFAVLAAAALVGFGIIYLIEGHNPRS